MNTITDVKSLPRDLPSDVEERASEFVEIPVVAELSAATHVGAIIVEPFISDEILLGSLRHRRLKVRIPIRVSITPEGSQFVAEAPEYNEFGFATDPWGAVSDLQRALVELYFELEQRQENLGPDLKATWQGLNEAVERSPNVMANDDKGV